MTQNYFIYATLLISMILQSCNANDPSLTLNIPKSGFEVIQHIPSTAEGRDQNTLYLAPRSINDEEFNSPELKLYIDSMYAVMLRKAGVGIASNQLGKSLQIFMIEAKSDNPRYKVLGPVAKQVFINPKITKTSKERKNFWHGCLSAHGEKRGNVATYEWIEYTCQNQKGEIQHGRLEGFASVIFQHEFRHMLSGTYLDHANHFLPKEELNEKLDAGELAFFELANDTLPLLIDGYIVGETLEEFHSRKK
ncbi:MAG: peptide deformylase [Crocinitomicaceae bacterium]|nr:peptide deformylase [Flavobacteriales bacterium]NQZ36388.1 peptide deformylase [Crocinitomicaceae bacterium]